MHKIAFAYRHVLVFVECNLLSHITDHRPKAAAWSSHPRPPWWHTMIWMGPKNTHKDAHTQPDETNFGREQRMLTVTIETWHKGRGREGETEEEAGS